MRTMLTRITGAPGASLYLLLLACLLLAPWNVAAPELAGLERAALREGEYWRFLTGPLVHESWQHMGLNLAALVLLQQLFGTELRPVVWLWGYMVIACLIGIGLLAFSRYGMVTGLSGVLHGLFVYAACLALRRDALLAAGVLLVIGAKVVWEQMAGPSSLMESWLGMPVAVDVHFYGAAAGAVLGASMAGSAGYSLLK